jgi:hypothetical protein
MTSFEMKLIRHFQGGDWFSERGIQGGATPAPTVHHLARQFLQSQQEYSIYFLNIINHFLFLI